MSGCDIDNYTLDGYNLDKYGVLDSFRNLMVKAVRKVVKGGHWFTCCKQVSPSQVDIMAIENAKKVKMGSLIGNKYYPDTVYMAAIYKHFLREYLCYYEVPSLVKSYDTDTVKAGYTKELITSNIAVIASWLGIPMEEAVNKYMAYLDDAYLDDGDTEFPYVKLYEKKDGRRCVTKPRSRLDLIKSGTRIIPMFALEEGMSYLYNECCKSVCRITYLKDGGVERKIDITFNRDILREIYGNDFAKYLDGCYDGDFFECQTIIRGYFRGVEVGGSRYGSILRSINIGRILSFECGVEPDLTFLDIDMDGIVDSFKSGLSSNMQIIKGLVEDLQDQGVMTEKDAKQVNSSFELESWAETKSVLLGTVFLRSLALFMLANPSYFPEYDGSPKVYSADTADIQGNSGTNDKDGVEVDLGFALGDIDFSE